MFNYKWYLKDNYKNSIKNNLNVFSCFACGGGSTMGYKLAGYNCLGGCDIDKKVADLYILNHKPKFFFIKSIKDIIKEKTIYENLYNLDILDGSPPCLCFSICGKREKTWNIENKKFIEGNTKQRIDDLFLYFLDFANIIKPKVIIAENVKGLIIGKAKGYAKIIYKKFEEIGYKVQLFLFNSMYLGVPQKRERLFFIAQRNDFYKKDFIFNFKQKKIILFKEVCDYEDKNENLSNFFKENYDKLDNGALLSSLYNKKYFNYRKLSLTKVAPTLTTNKRNFMHPIYKRCLNKYEYCLINSFPLDYNFSSNRFDYIIGMSVPPVLMANISYNIYLQLFKNKIG